MKLSAIRQESSRKPGRILTVPPTVWSSEWAKAPTTGIVVGLRLISEGDAMGATDQANKHADKAYRDDKWSVDWIDSRNGYQLRFLVARALCDPNDVEKPHESIPMAEDLLQMALTPNGGRWLYEEIERYADEVSPMNRPATDDEVSVLGSKLIEDGLYGLSEATEAKVRRYLKIALDELVAMETDEEDLPMAEAML